MDYGRIPEELHFSHNFCFFLHDQLVSTIKEGSVADIFSISFKTAEPITEGLTGEELFAWMEKNGFREEILLLYYKQLTAALLSDFLNFTFEALKCSAKGKLTVSYALLRKPLKENLFYLEWLLADPLSMLEAFEGENLILRSAKSVSPERKKEIIAAAMHKTSMGDWTDAEFIYDLRYNKKCIYGYEALFQKANHLVTQAKPFETEPANFNFIFSNEESLVTQWHGFYSYLPLILIHAIEVVEALVSNFAERDAGVPDLTFLRTMIGFSHWTDTSPNRIQKTTLLADFQRSVEGVDLLCPECNVGIFSDEKSLFELYESNALRCSRCGWGFDLNVPPGDGDDKSGSDGELEIPLGPK